MSFKPPSDRDGFTVAIICALKNEFNAVSLVFDEFWDDDEDKYGKASGDPNHYTVGRIGNHDVVLALLPHMGKVNAASAAASMRFSYRALSLALIVGVCGGVPTGQHGEVLLGDVIISSSVVQYDAGRQYPNRFERKNTQEDVFGRLNKDIQGLIRLFETDRGMKKLETRTASCLEQLQAKAASDQRIGKDRYGYPGIVEDKLFEPTYRHKHHRQARCICRECIEDADPVCNLAISSLCINLGCDETHLVRRDRLEQKQRQQANSTFIQQPLIHIGSIASGDTVMKSAIHRDNIAQQEDVIAFEMEGAGVWDEMPCMMVKGVCDYADSHKHKGWQNFAAATAAATAKAIIERYTQTDKSMNSKRSEAVSPEGDRGTVQHDQPPASMPGSIFSGPITGRNVIAGSSMTGGTYSFG
ncbi:hypothetical protein E8E14_007171 [Neopestalotiopsis sp. 37M]|nr:hypothetical protein E8E14_007171 [Neopestalotiopsis sp. 37M]